MIGGSDTLVQCNPVQSPDGVGPRLGSSLADRAGSGVEAARGVLDGEGSDAETDGRCVAEVASGVAALVHPIATMPSTIVATSPPSGRRPRLPPLATIRSPHVRRCS